MANSTPADASITSVVVSKLNEILDYLNEQEMDTEMMNTLMVIGNIKIILMSADEFCMKLFIDKFLTGYMAGLMSYSPEKFRSKTLFQELDMSSTTSNEERKKLMETQKQLEKLMFGDADNSPSEEQ